MVKKATVLLITLSLIFLLPTSTSAAANDFRVIYNGSNQRHTGTTPAGFTAIDSYTFEAKLSNLRWSFGTTQRIVYIDNAFRIFINASSTTLTFAAQGNGGLATTNITGNSQTSLLVRAVWDRGLLEWRLEVWNWDESNRVQATTAVGSALTFNAASQPVAIGGQTDGTNHAQVKVDWARWKQGAVALNQTPPRDGDTGTYYAAWEFENNGNDETGNINLTAQNSPTFESVGSAVIIRSFGLLGVGK